MREFPLDMYVIPIINKGLHFTTADWLTNSWPIHVLESDSEVKLITTSQIQSDVDHITLSDSVGLLSKQHS